MCSAGGNSCLQLLATCKKDTEPDLTDAADRDVVRRGPGLLGLDWPLITTHLLKAALRHRGKGRWLAW